MDIFERILSARNISPAQRASFLSPSYEQRHDPFLLPDMLPAVERMQQAYTTQERIMIYGDYDIDGLTATTILLEALQAFGYKHVNTYIPNRFVEGYGLTRDAVDKIAAEGADIIITVDCGSLSEAEIIHAKELNIDVIVTDHHNVAPKQPPAVAVINPKRCLQDHPEMYEDYLLKSRYASEKIYPFLDISGVGVAFKFIEALQTVLSGLPKGQEKWLLDLVALGTVCDVVTLKDENRLFVYWGLKVLAKTRRKGLRALMRVAGVEPDKLNARSLGFSLGPRMNAAGRLETAQYTLDMLTSLDDMKALEKAQLLDDLNKMRRHDQDAILKEAIIQAEKYQKDDVLVVSAPGWNHGIIGIVAAKLLERYKKPTYVLEELGEESKGSARSYGDFSAADAIRAADDLIIKGGGHKLAAGVTIPTKNIGLFRERVNAFYKSQDFQNQSFLLLPQADLTVLFDELSETLVHQLELLEPFGNGNKEPIFHTTNVKVIAKRTMGSDGQHVKLELQDIHHTTLQFLAFNAPESFFVEPGKVVEVWYILRLNEWQGRSSVEAQLLHLAEI